MIFQQAIRREFTHSAAGIFVALFAIVLTTQLIRLLGSAAAGRIAPEAVVALLGFAALNYIPALLSVSAFMAILLSLSRSYRDSEMVVWFSSGLSLTAWIRPVLIFIAPLIVAIAALSFFATPWSAAKSAEYRSYIATRKDTGAVSPGVFQESSQGDTVVFVEAVADDATFVKNVFAASMGSQHTGVTMAATGRHEISENGDRFIVLEHGSRYELTPGSSELRILEYARYAIRLTTRAAPGVDVTPRSMPTLGLIKINLPPYRAELLWRLGIPISATILALLAIPFSFVNPRAGRSANMFIALCMYFIYNNLISISEAWVASGRISFIVGLLSVHLLMLCLVPLMFFRRIAVFSFSRLAQ